MHPLISDTVKVLRRIITVVFSVNPLALPMLIVMVAFAQSNHMPEEFGDEN